MSQHTINQAARHAKRERRLGANASCQHCGWPDSVALGKDESGITCYACQHIRNGRTTTERHHPLGRSSDPATVMVEGNIHRALSDLQIAWPTDVLRNPERDPLLWLAAAMLGLHDHLAWWVVWLERIATWLVQLARLLQEREGVRWWESLALAPVWQEAGS
jgi:hypothetical protein